MILWREGWLGSARRNKNAPTTAEASDDQRRMRARRRAVGLASPYGLAARKPSKTAPLRPVERKAAKRPPPDAGPPDEPWPASAA